jgi:chromosome segregation ATPase
MVLSKDGKYMLDRKSPLTGRDFEILFSGSSKLTDLKRIARKAGLSSYDKMTKAEIVDAVESTLKGKNIREPIRLQISAQKRVVSVNNNNRNYPNNLNVNNRNGNGVRNNLSKISRESENLGRNNNNNNKNNNNQTENKNLNSISTESKNLNNNGSGNNNRKVPVNATTARYLNAMTRKPNANRNADISKILSAMRNKNQSPGDISSLIQSIQGKRTMNGETKTYLDKFVRAQKNGNATAMKNIAKRLNYMERERRAVEPSMKPKMTNKEKRSAELEKYMINKSKNLNKNRVKFLNEGQKFIRGYKNGNNIYNTAKARINSLYSELKNKKSLNSQTPQAPQQPTISNQPSNGPTNTELKQLQNQLSKSTQKIASLEQKIESANTNKQEQIARIKNLESQLRQSGLSNDERKRLENQLANAQGNALVAAKELENLKKNRNETRGAAALAQQQVRNLEENVRKSREEKTSLQKRLNAEQSDLSNALQKINKIEKGKNSALRKVSTLQNNISSRNTEILKLKNKLESNASLSTSEKKALQKNLNAAISSKQSLQKELTGTREEANMWKTRLVSEQKALKEAEKLITSINFNLRESKKKTEKLQTEYQTLVSNMQKQINNAKANANKEIANLRNKLQKNKNLSNGEKRALQEQLNNAMKNRANINNRLRKSESEKMQYMREMNTLAGNVRNITKQKENANAQITAKNQEINQIKKNMAAAGSMSMAQKEKLRKNLENAQKEKANISKQLSGFRSELEMAKERLAQERVEKNAKIRSLEANEAIARAKANAEIANLRNKLQKNKNLSNGEKRALQEQLNNAMKNRANINNRLRKSESEKMQYMLEMNTLAGNVRNIAKQKENANKEIANLRNKLQKNKNLSNGEKRALQEQINVYRAKANKIIRNGATREATQRNRIKALETNLNSATQRLAEKNASLLEKIEQINQTQSNVARLKNELNKKSASAAEKNEIKNRLEAEKQNLTRQFTETQTVLNSTKSQLSKIKENRNTLFKELQKRSGNLLETEAERNKLQKQLGETKQILRNTQNNLGQLALAEQRARRQRNTLSKTLAQVRGQRQNLRRRNAASQKVITGLTQQRQNAQRGINTLRAATRNLEQKRLAANRTTNNTFNASAAFNRQMKGVAARQSWQSLKPKATMIGASQLGVGKSLRAKLLKNIDMTNLNGKHVVDGTGNGFIPIPGSERRDLKNKVKDPMTGLNRLRDIEKMILNRKKNRNNKILGRRRMNEVLKKHGTNVKPINYRGFAASGKTGLTNTTRATGNMRTKLKYQV